MLNPLGSDPKRSPTALLSVYEKEGIVEFAKELLVLGFDILSSGGTAKALSEAGLPVTDVATVSGLNPVLGHRVVTLVPQVHGGLLATEEQREELEKLGWPWIDLACVDLYPLKAEIAKPGATRQSVIEKTDIGGPTMIRSATKGRRIVVCDPADRARVIAWMKSGKPDEDAFVTALCAKAEGVVADYCLASARYHSGGDIDGFGGTKALACKYGENAWQNPAALYSTGTDDPLALDRFTLVAGQPPSYNNLCDLDRLLQTATHIAASPKMPMPAYIAVGAKHGNACGAAEVVDDGDRLGRRKALERMIDGDKRALFGGLVLTNFDIDVEDADVLLAYGMESGRRLLDGIIAPRFTEGAVELLKRKGDKCRFLANPALAGLRSAGLDQRRRFRYVRGGFLAQPNYAAVPDWKKIAFATEDGSDLHLAWAVGSTSNSNTITLVKNGMLIGNGVGQQDRVGCCELAIKRARDAGHDVKGAAAYSDSFFPFADGPMVLAQAGVRAIFATSGSVKDDEVRAACERAGVRLYLLPDTEARGFFGH